MKRLVKIAFPTSKNKYIHTRFLHHTLHILLIVFYLTSYQGVQKAEGMPGTHSLHVLNLLMGNNCIMDVSDVSTVG